MADNQPYRVLELLKRFNNNQMICLESLKYDPLWEGKNEKTIRRDLDIIKRSFPDSFHPVKGQRGCYKAITTETYDHLTSSNNLALLVQIFKMAKTANILDKLEISAQDKKIIEKEIKKSEGSYLFISKPYENNIADYELLNKLEKAIYHQYHLTVEYQGPNAIEVFAANPYKIIFMNEVFYLACEIEDRDFIFTLFRISNIKSVISDGKKFHKNYDLDEFIYNIQTPFSNYVQPYKKHLIQVVLEVDSSKSRYFVAKKYLQSQKILETKENGNLLISYTVTQESEVEDIVKKWMPFVNVIEPSSLKNSLLETLRKTTVLFSS